MFFCVPISWFRQADWKSILCLVNFLAHWLRCLRLWYFFRALRTYIFFFVQIWVIWSRSLILFLTLNTTFRFCRQFFNLFVFGSLRISSWHFRLSGLFQFLLKQYRKFLVCFCFWNWESVCRLIVPDWTLKYCISNL